jgi:hypothetical protein
METVQVVTTHIEEPQWKNVVVGVNDGTRPDKMKPASIKMPKTIDINEAHDMCGHKGEPLLRKTYKRLGDELTGKLRSCKGCCFAKAKAKLVSKTALTKATKPGERLFLDTTGLFSPTLNGHKFWIQVMDGFT